MSRTLSKIMVICAMVVILPLMIVGTAFAAFYSVESIVNIAVTVDALSPASDVYAGIAHENEQSILNSESAGTSTATLEISGSQTEEITVNAVYSSNAYRFLGWYAGDMQAYTNAVNVGNVEFVSTDEALTIGMDDGDNYVAVYEVVRYTVSEWNYLEDPENEFGAIITTAPQDGKSEYIYGETLPDVSYMYQGTDFRYAGWQIDDSGTRYLSATFPQGTQAVTLANPWIESDKTTVVFHNGGEQQSVDINKNEPWTPSTVNEIFPDLIRAGYTYSWVDSEGYTVSSINTNLDVYNLYASSQVVQYTATVTSGEDATFDGETQITFNAENTTTNFEDFFNAENWTTKYSFWDFAGLTYESATYTQASDLSTVVSDFIEANPTGSEDVLTLGVDIQKFFTEFENQDSITFKATEDADGIFYNLDVYTEVDFGLPASEYEIVGSEELGEDYEAYETSITLNELLTLDTTPLFVAVPQQGGDGETTYAKYNAVLKQVTVILADIDGGANIEITMSVDGTETINDVIEYVLQTNDIAETARFTVVGMEAGFYAEEIIA